MSDVEQLNGFPQSLLPHPYERSENLLSALALQAAWTYHSADMPCAAFTPVSTHVFASTPAAECRIKEDYFSTLKGTFSKIAFFSDFVLKSV